MDIPEVLVLSSYFLMAAFPQKKFLLYKEGQQDFSKLEQYDVILMPNFVLPQLGGETVDLFFNQASFSEMDSTTVEEYLHQVERICRRYLMHINHNTKFEFKVDGVETHNMPCNQVIPSPNRFKRIYRHPWMFNKKPEEIRHRGVERYIAFLYERRRNVVFEEPKG